MKLVKKKNGKLLKAYQLGTDHEVLRQLLKEGKIKETETGEYEVFSQEAKSGRGEVAQIGDYIKLDSTGMPYPNDKKYFEENHRHIQGDEFEQIPKPIWAWERKDGMCPEIEHLMKHCGLEIDETSKDSYFRAPLWGTVLSAAEDAMIVFYHIQENQGIIEDISFNFVSREEFLKTYDLVLV